MKFATYWVLAFLCVLSVFLISCNANASITFDSFEPGNLPPGWEPSSVNGQRPHWEIVRDTTAPSQPNVLAQVSTQSPGYPVATLETQLIADGSVSVMFKPLSGEKDQTGGVVWRYRDPKNYYLALASVVDGSVSAYKVENGKRIGIQVLGAKEPKFHVQRKIHPNEWSTLKVRFRGDRFAVYYNHRELFQVADSTFSGPGKVGLWTLPDAITYFDDFRVEAKR